MIERRWRPPGVLKPLLTLAPWGFPRQILMILTEGDMTLPEIRVGFIRFMHHFGYFGREENVAGYTEELFNVAVLEAMEKLLQDRAVIQHGEIYSLTPQGRLRAEKMQRELRTFGRWIERFLYPQTVALVGLGVHILLAVLKLIAGVISRSIGLISDGMDTAMDGLSSVLVFVGLRLKKEKVVNVVLVLLMLVVGIGAGYEAVYRVFVPEEVEVDLLTFSAAILSGLVCLLLSLYQRFVATRSWQQPLIAQAVDSRNHAIVAAGVITGLVATLLRFPLLDTLVGLGVAVLILKSGVELLLDTVRALRGEEVDLTRYELEFVEEYRRFQAQQFTAWLLHIIAEEGPLPRLALLPRCRELLNVQDVPILRELGWGREVELEKKMIGALETLLESGLITARDVLQITEKGRLELVTNSYVI
jgi:cation diffusion facilitator family transporter